MMEHSDFLPSVRAYLHEWANGESSKNTNFCLFLYSLLITVDASLSAKQEDTLNTMREIGLLLKDKGYVAGQNVFSSLTVMALKFLAIMARPLIEGGVLAEVHARDGSRFRLTDPDMQSIEDIMQIRADFDKKLAHFYPRMFSKPHLNICNPSAPKGQEKPQQLRIVEAKETPKSVGETQCVGGEVPKQKNPSGTKRGEARVATPKDKLKKKISLNFDLKTFIGDIPISDDDYAILLEHFKRTVKATAENRNYHRDDPMLCVALVQIGIRKYDKCSFWPHVKDELGLGEFPPTLCKRISDIFFHTLKKHKRRRLHDGECVATVLMHGFVCDICAPEFFDFLFKYYELDLGRDLALMNMKALGDAILNANGAKRTYMLLHQTVAAFRENTAGCKARIRRFLKLIDRHFWNPEIPIRASSRLMKLFESWTQTSEAFRFGASEAAKASGNRKRVFSSPYIHCMLKDLFFSIKCPRQLIRYGDRDPERAWWQISSGEWQAEIECEMVKVVSGLRVEETTVDLPAALLFDRISLKLHTDLGKERPFVIEGSRARFIDKEGDQVGGKTLPPGRLYAITPAGEPISSEALISGEPSGSFLLSDLELQMGDLISLSSGKVLRVGGLTSEGPAQRGCVLGATAEIHQKSMPVYASKPGLILKLKDSGFNGTLVAVNGGRKKLAELNVLKFEPGERSDESGWFVRPDALGCLDDGVYDIVADSPSDDRVRQWSFALLAGFSADFEIDSGDIYIFRNRGTLKLPDGMRLSPLDSENRIEKEAGTNTFNFPICDDLSVLRFGCESLGDGAVLCVPVPALFWQFDGDETWHVDRPKEVWHADFPRIIRLKCPTEDVRLSLNDDDAEAKEEHEQLFRRPQDAQIITCDMSRFRSWFSRDNERSAVNLEAGGMRKRFMDVVNRSSVSSGILEGDYARGMLVARFEIIGKSDYAVDIYRSDALIARKIPLADGTVEYPAELLSGDYRMELFESEPDDSGFDEVVFYPLYQCSCELIDPYHLTGKVIELCSLIGRDRASEDVRLRTQKRIELTRKIDDNTYDGLMAIPNPLREQDFAHVQIQFPDLNDIKRCGVRLLESDGWTIAFLYDADEKKIVQDQDVNELLPISIRYRRYQLLDDDNLFEIAYVEGLAGESLPSRQLRRVRESTAREKAVPPPHQDKTLTEIGVSFPTRYALSNNGVETVDQLLAFLARTNGKWQSRIRNMTDGILKEIQSLIREYRGRNEG